jgi:hypothetical protein
MNRSSKKERQKNSATMDNNTISLQKIMITERRKKKCALELFRIKSLKKNT